MSNKTLYAVSCGEYSDYSVVAIFDDKALAEKYIEMYIDKDGYRSFNDLEEYELNPYEEQMAQGLFCYGVSMDRNGNSKVEKGAAGECKVYIRQDKKSFFIRVFAKDEQHAVKIANEKRVQLIANNELI